MRKKALFKNCRYYKRIAYFFVKETIFWKQMKITIEIEIRKDFNLLTSPLHPLLLFMFENEFKNKFMSEEL